MDKCLPFGLRSAPFLFNMVADALELILRSHFHQQYCFHYLDNFFFAGTSQSDACLVTLMDIMRYENRSLSLIVYCRRLLNDKGTYI